MQPRKLYGVATSVYFLTFIAIHQSEYVGNKGQTVRVLLNVYHFFTVKRVKYN